MPKQLDPCCLFDITPACDRQTDGQTDTRRQIIPARVKTFSFHERMSATVNFIIAPIMAYSHYPVRRNIGRRVDDSFVGGNVTKGRLR